MFKKYATITLTISASGYLIYRHYKNNLVKSEAKIFNRRPLMQWKPPCRTQNIKDLKTKEFDLLIIGAGASGTGCALDATTRGLNVALVDSGDFASQTSSKSTKLLHGGIRYLEKAFKNFDLEQYSLVKEALAERKTVMDNCPYLTSKLPFLLPVYNKVMIPYFLMGMKVYDYIAGSHSLGRSFFMNRCQLIEKFPAIKKENLQGAIVYNDAQFNDSRYAVMLAMTSCYYGATVANYVGVKELIKENGIIKGAVCVDKITNEVFKVHAKGVINTCGPYIDKIRKMEQSNIKSMVEPSSGVHLVLPPEFAPNNMALVIPGTTDGRILFFIPWQGKAIVGTTDNKCTIKKDPKATQDEINFIIDEIKENINYPETLSRKTVLAAWSGIRPLVKNPNDTKTEELVRNHIVTVSDSKMLTLSGGKWTTYRKMAEDAIDIAVKEFNLHTKRNCVTKFVKLLGSHTYNEDLFIRLKRDLDVDISTAKHLARSYGDRSYKLRDYPGFNKNKLSLKYDYLEKEIDYCVDYEMAQTISDILARRMRLGFIDVKEASKLVDKVSFILKRKLGWDERKRRSEQKDSIEYLKSLGLGII